MNTHLCQIESTLGRSTPCPEERCSLWQDGVCVVAGLSADLTRTPGLAELLLDVRTRLDEASAQDDALLLPGLR
jgi:hypothetical protein